MSRAAEGRRVQHAVMATASEWARIRELAEGGRHGGLALPGSPGDAAPTALPAAVLRRAVRELLLLSKLEEARMADMGLEERWASVGDAVDAWLDREAELDRLSDAGAAERWRAASPGADPERRPGAASLMAVLRRSLRCTPLERARIRERAREAGMPVSRFVVACALKDDTGGEPGIVLSEEEQRRLYDRVAELDRLRRLLLEALPGTGGVAVRGSRRDAPRARRARGGRLMPARRAIPPARLAVSCRESEWERIREIALRRGMTINEYLVAAALAVDPAPAAPALALSAAEQRRLLETVGAAGRRHAGRDGRAPRRDRAACGNRSSCCSARRCAAWSREGREAEILLLLIETFGAEHRRGSGAALPGVDGTRPAAAGLTVADTPEGSMSRDGASHAEPPVLRTILFLLPGLLFLLWRGRGCARAAPRPSKVRGSSRAR